MIAVIKTGGKQYKVKEGSKVKVEKLPADKGGKIVFDKVLLVSGDDGKDLRVGNPIVAGVTVEASLVGQGRAKKVMVVKYKPKIRYHKKTGHRQAFTEVKIEKILA